MGDFRLSDTNVDPSYETLNELLDVIKYIDQNKIMSFAFENGYNKRSI